MDTNTTSDGSTTTRSPQGRRELTRPRHDRMAVGVAAGLAHYLDMSTALVRVGFVVTAFFGGLGIVLYLAGWLLIRADDEARSPAQRIFDDVRSGRSWIGLALVALAALIVLDTLTFLPGSLVWATVLVVVGYLLYRGDIPDPSGRPDRSVGAQPPANAAETSEVAGDEGGAGADLPPSASAPHAPPPPPPAPPRPKSHLGRITMGVTLLALGILAVADNLTPLLDPRPRHYLALATVVIGIGLVTGGWLGRARWMILLGILVIPPLLVSPVAEVDWDGDLERVIEPATLDELRSPYEFTAGRIVVDLRNVEWNGETVDLDVETAAGALVLMVPDGVGVTGTASVDIGAVETPSAERSGFGELAVSLSEPGDDGTVEADLHTGVGVVEIVVGSSAPTGGRLSSEIDVDPTTATQLADYDIGVGNLHLDLTDLELDDDADFDMEVGMGDIDIVLPDDLNVVIDAASGAGTVDLPGSRSSGLGSSRTYERLDREGPVLHLDLDVATGDIVVTERSN